LKAQGELRFSEVFYGPVIEELKSCGSRRNCIALSDEEFLQAGIGRCLESVKSGREWVQRFRHMHSKALTVSNFFDALNSDRRMALVKEIASGICALTDRMADPQADPFSAHEELDGFAVYAADGHYHQASTHETKIQGKLYPVGHLYAMNLRTQSMRHLDVCRPIERGRKKEHDMSVLKRLDGETLRMGEPRGRRVLLAYDPAVIDFTQWHNWKQSRGVYIITREKENMNPMPCGLRDFDRDDERNIGIIKDEQIGVSGGTMIRRIVHVDPASGKEHSFITNEMTLPPGLIAFIYLRRWDIEKVYDEFKNHLDETKAWGDSATIKCQQADFVCTTHNLLLLLERRLDKEEGIREEKIEPKRRTRRAQVAARINEDGRLPNPLAQACYRCVKRTLQFLREVRLILAFKTSWRQAVDSIRPIMRQYLT